MTQSRDDRERGEMKISLRYRFDKKIRAVVMWVMGRITQTSTEQRVDLRRQNIKKILLVRGIFRMGNSILATPAIVLFRKNFPNARIDFVGPGISKSLFQKLPINHYHVIHHEFPKVCWSYLRLLRKIRAVKYDLAVDVGGSNAALGAFIVGFSGARFRAGLRGKWDDWFNLRFARPAEKNKYGRLPQLIAAMGLESHKILPTLVLSFKEKEAARKRLEKIFDRVSRPVVGIFVGGRKARGKRWPKQNFLPVADALRRLGANVVIFVGPEERELISYFQQVLRERIPVVSESDPRGFAAMVANCDLFVACDSGPVHVACALGVRTVAIFLQNNFDRWGPPSTLARIVYQDTGVSAAEVTEACRIELVDLSTRWDAAKIVNA
jgi:ADP-heptose:LPS heptosyltransferase